MSAEKAPDAEAPAPKKKGKLLIIIVSLVLVLGGGGGAAWFFLGQGDKEKSADAEHAGADEQHAAADDEKPFRPRVKKKGEPPVFADLEPFIFNLQDEDQDRFAQVGVTLELVDAEVTAELKQVEPAVRNAILMLLSSKTSDELLSVDGKLELADQIIDFANTIMAGEPLPRFKSSRQAAKEAAADDHDDRRDRRAKYIPECVLNTHFKQFIVQ